MVERMAVRPIEPRVRCSEGRPERSAMAHRQLHPQFGWHDLVLREGSPKFSELREALGPF
jgi:hypothetical protein